MKTEDYQLEEAVTHAFDVIASNWAETDMTDTADLPIAVVPRYLGGRKRFELTYPAISDGTVTIALNEGQLRTLQARIALALAHHDAELRDSLDWK